MGFLTTITACVARILANPAPVIVFDTCTLLDLFRYDTGRKQPRVATAEIETAQKLLQQLTANPHAAHLVVPELVPGEFADHADKIEREFDEWLVFHDNNQLWLIEAASAIGVSLPSILRVHPLGLRAGFRKLADELLAHALILSRDHACVEPAVDRLIKKRRPSHKKEMKDSMNLEQCLELSTCLHQAGFVEPRVFVSSNTNDFAQSTTNSRVHADLQAEFGACGLEYFTTMQAALGSLRGRGALP